MIHTASTSATLPTAQIISDVPPLSSVLSKTIQGGAAWSYQLHPDPYALPAAVTLKRALDLGIRAFDTSPYYHPSEIILGAAFQDTLIKNVYQRKDYLLMTKVGRIAANEFNYSPEWVRTSILRSLERFKTDYLDVVFCHDVEFVSEEEALGAIGVLWEFVREGKVRYVGISGYPIPKLIHIAKLARERFGRPLDVVQNWAQLTLQNTRLLKEGLPGFREAGVDVVCSSSPLAIGLLRDEGVPEGSLGDFHPAPKELRAAVSRAAEWVRERDNNLASLALRYAFTEALKAREGFPMIAIIGGAGSVEQVEDFVKSFEEVTRDESKQDEVLVEGVRGFLADWIDYCFT